MSRLEENEYAAWVNTFEPLSFKELAEAFKSIKDEIAEKDHEIKKQKEIFDLLRLKIIPDKLDQEGLSSINIRGVGRLGVTLDCNVSVLAENRAAFYEWLEAEGHGGIIKPYAQPATVKAFIKEQIKEGHKFPDDLVKADPFFRASVTKS